MANGDVTCHLLVLILHGLKTCEDGGTVMLIVRPNERTTTIQTTQLRMYIETSKYVSYEHRLPIKLKSNCSKYSSKVSCYFYHLF